MSSASLTPTDLVRYGFLAAPVAFAGFPLYVLAPDFYATQHGISLSVLGIALLMLRAFDAAQDPLIGVWSDRLSQRIMPILLAAAFLLLVSIAALFHPMGAHKLAWFCIAMVTAVCAYSILSINLNALGAHWTQDADQQVRIAGAREAFGLIGLVLAVSMPSLLSKFVPPTAIYFWFSMVLAVMMGLALLAFCRWYRAQPKTVNKAAHSYPTLLATLRSLPRATRQLFFVYGLSMLASSIPAVLVVFFIRDRLGAEALSGVFLLVYFLSGALTMPLWRTLSANYGTHKAWLFSMLLAVASFCGAYFLSAGDVWAYGLICVASGMALGGDLALPPSILAAQLHSNGSDATAATQFSLLALLAKLALALGSALALPLLDVAGFIPAAVNSADALSRLSSVYALLPCIIKLICAFFLIRFFITPQRKTRYETVRETYPDRSRPHA